MQRKTYFIILTSLLWPFLLCAQTQGSITFMVDENITPIEKKYHFLSGEQMSVALLNGENIRKEYHQVIANSFNDAQCLTKPCHDAFFRCIVDAYAKHREVTLSPDMIWLLISQGFARYVNAHAEALRTQLVDFEGKMDLTVESQQDLLSEPTNWIEILDGLVSQIGKYTKNDISENITANFTTTGPAERIASQITLMESVRPYFEYVVYNIACGIPSITLEGTPDDWREVLKKTQQLERYGLNKWTNRLEPILSEFIRAAEGQPNQKFWKEMVKKQPVDQLEGGACKPGKPTELDGWILSFFPDENGMVRDMIPFSNEMPSEYVRVGFKYRVIGEKGQLSREIPMELWAGFIGVEVDTISYSLTPKIGWLVRVAQTEEDYLNELNKQNTDLGIELRIKELPDILSRIDEIKCLRLIFTDEVILPEWFFHKTIHKLFIEGSISTELKERIINYFPKAVIKEKDKK